MADPARKLERARRDARRFASDARALAARRRGLGKDEREEIEAAAGEVDAASDAGDPERLSRALHTLDALWGEHLQPPGRPLWREYARMTAAAVAAALLVRGFVVEAFSIPSGSMAPTLLVGDRVFVSKLSYGPRIPFTRVRLLRLGEPRRGDVVVFENPRDPSMDMVKRVVGVPGDVVEVREQVLYVNGVPQPRSPDGELTYEERDDSGRPFEDRCVLYRESLAKGEMKEPDPDREGTAEASWQAAAGDGVASFGVLQCLRSRIASREGPFETVKPGHVFVVGDNRDRSSDSRSHGGWQVPFDRVKGRAKAVFWSFGRGDGAWPRGHAGVRFVRLFKPVE